MDKEFEKTHEDTGSSQSGTENIQYADSSQENPQAQNGSRETSPTEHTTYYTPPKREDSVQENTTYHYAYTNRNQNKFQGNPQQGTPYGGYSSPYSQQNAYQNNQTQSAPYSQPFGGSSATDSEPVQSPKKKSKAVKIILAVFAVCIVIAIAGIVVSTTGLLNDGKQDDSNNDTSQSESVNDVQPKDSEEVPTVDKDGNYTVAGVAKECMDSCVGITVYTNQTNAYDYFYNYGNSQSSGEPSKSGEGSGILMKEENGKTYVLTCAHVISDGDSFTVTLNDGTECEAQMVAYDAQTDIGVISINKTGLKIAEFADSEQVVVGEQVVAIGCPGGLEFMNSVTSGYISALARPISSSIGYDTDCIQTDTAINPGNSGGALFNMQGQVIGVNSSKIASTEYEGMGFAVPSVTALATANSLIKSGYVEGRAKLGITYNVITNFNNSQAVIQALAQKGFENAEGTMVINDVSEDSDLANKDIKQYDMIVAVNGKTLTSTDIMTSLLADSKPGDKVTLTIARIENNQISTREVECTLIESKG